VPLGGLPVLYCVRSPPTPGTYHLSLHDALPICLDVAAADGDRVADRRRVAVVGDRQVRIAGGGDAGFLLRAAADRGPARGGGDRGGRVDRAEGDVRMVPEPEVLAPAGAGRRVPPGGGREDQLHVTPGERGVRLQHQGDRARDHRRARRRAGEVRDVLVVQRRRRDRAVGAELARGSADQDVGAGLPVPGAGAVVVYGAHRDLPALVHIAVEVGVVAKDFPAFVLRDD